MEGDQGNNKVKVHYNELQFAHHQYALVENPESKFSPPSSAVIISSTFLERLYTRVTERGCGGFANSAIRALVRTGSDVGHSGRLRLGFWAGHFRFSTAVFMALALCTGASSCMQVTTRSLSSSEGK